MMSGFRLSAAVAITPTGGIGKDGTLPWKAFGITLSKDINQFKEITLRTRSPTLINAVIMGRKTFESIPKKFRPLSNRVNVVVSRDRGLRYDFPNQLLSNVEVVGNLNEAVDLLVHSDNYRGRIDTGVVIGGVELFEEVMFHPLCEEYHISRIITSNHSFKGEFDCDTFLTEKTMKAINDMSPVITSEVIEENGVQYVFQEYRPNTRLHIE